MNRQQGRRVFVGPKGGMYALGPTGQKIYKRPAKNAAKVTPKPSEMLHMRYAHEKTTCTVTPKNYTS